MHDIRLESLEVIDKYITLLLNSEEETNKVLTAIQNYDRETLEGVWSDKIHYQFSEGFIAPIQKSMLESMVAQREALTKIKEIRVSYSQIIN
jgi:hypothetical protein